MYTTCHDHLRCQSPFQVRHNDNASMSHALRCCKNFLRDSTKRNWVRNKSVRGQNCWRFCASRLNDFRELVRLEKDQPMEPGAVSRRRREKLDTIKHDMSHSFSYSDYRESCLAWAVYNGSKYVLLALMSLEYDIVANVIQVQCYLNIFYVRRDQMICQQKTR